MPIEPTVAARTFLKLFRQIDTPTVQAGALAQHCNMWIAANNFEANVGEEQIIDAARALGLPVKLREDRVACVSWWRVGVSRRSLRRWFRLMWESEQQRKTA